MNHSYLRIILIWAILLFNIFKPLYSENKWRVLNSYFDEKPDGIVWKASFLNHDIDNDEPEYQVSLSYRSNLKKDASLFENSQNLAEFSFNIHPYGKASICVLKQRLISAEAIAFPTTRYLYVFYLKLGNYLHIIREDYVVIDNSVSSLEQQTINEEDLLDKQAWYLLQAIKNKNESFLKKSTIYQLAHYIINSNSPLSDFGKEKILLISCKARINKKRYKLSIIKKPYGVTRLNIPAKTGDTIWLYPKYKIRTLIPYCNRVKITEKPLPSYALVELMKEDFSINLYNNKGSQGEFNIGPVQLNNMQTLNLKAYLPLFPPGLNPTSLTRIYFRTGRPIEKYLDKGELPTFPVLPDKITLNNIIPQIVKQINLSINPDTGQIQGVYDDELIDLYACAKETVSKYPSLLTIVRKKLDNKWNQKKWSFSSLEERLFYEKGWTDEDAKIVLKNPSLANQLAERIRSTPDPLYAIKYATKSSRIYPDELDKNPRFDTNTLASHALASAALIHTDDYTYSDIINKKISLLIKKKNRILHQDFDDIYFTCQALKLIAYHLKNNKKRMKIVKLIKTIKQYCLTQFAENHDKLSLYEKIRIAHMISPVWRPFLKTPPEFYYEDKISDRNRIPEQSIIGSEGQNITKAILEQDRRRYRAALKNSIHKIKNSNMSQKEKKEWMNNFLDEWHGFLFNSHKGGYLQNYEKKLKQDRIRALKKITKGEKK